jgi:ribosomal protein L11
MDDIRKIAEQKLSESNTDNLEAMTKTVMGSAKSMGVQVVE